MKTIKVNEIEAELKKLDTNDKRSKLLRKVMEHHENESINQLILDENEIQSLIAEYYGVNTHNVDMLCYDHHVTVIIDLTKN